MSSFPPSPRPEAGEPPRQSAASRAELKEATFAGLRWIALARVLGEATTLASMVTLAHLIAPAEFGRAAIAMIVPVLASVLTFEGFGSALVQRDSVDARHFKTAFALAAVTGLLFALLILLAGPALVTPLFGSRTADLVRLTAPTFLISGLGAVPSAILQRRLDFRSMIVAETTGFAVAAVTSVTLALAGLEAEAIVLGAIAATFTTVLLLTRAAPPRGIGFDRSAARDLLAFGVPAGLQGLTWMATRNIDYAIVGARLGPHALGIYWRSYQLGVEYQGKISRIMTRVAFPVYSRTEGRAHMSAVHSRVLRVHAVVLFPLLALLISTAPVLLPWLLGARWEPAVVPTQFLGVAGMMLALIAGLGQATMAAGKPGALALNNVFSLAVYAPVVYFVAPAGLVPLSIAVTCTVLFTGSVAAYMLLDRAVGIPLRRLVSDAAPATLGSVALVIVALPLTRAMDAAHVPAVPLLAVATLAGLAVYLVTVHLVSPAAWADLRLLLSGLRSRAPVERAVTQPTSSPGLGLE